MSRTADRPVEHGLPVPVPVGTEVDLGTPGRGFVRLREGRNDVRPVVLLHGLTATAGINWMHAFGSLPAGRTVVAPDLRGHGRGPHAPRGVSIDDHVADVVALCDALGLEAPTVVGFSFGGAVAQELALRAPARIGALVLVSTASRFRMGPISGRLYGLNSSVAKLARLLPTSITEVLEKRFVPSPDPAVRRFVLEEVRRSDRRQLARNAAALRRFRSTDRLPSIEVPTSVVVSTADRTLHPAVQRRLARDIPAARLVEAPVGHSGLIWEPDVAVPKLLEAIDVAEST